MASFSGIKLPPPKMRNGSGAAGSHLQSALCGNNFFQNSIQRAGNAPIGVMRAELGQVRDVADVVALAVLVDILPIHWFAGHLPDFGDTFEHGDAVFSTAAEVVDLATARAGRKHFDRTDDIMAMYVIADLLAFISINGIGAAGNGHLHEVGEEAVEFHAGM